MILSFFFCIFFESPILILEKMVFGKKREKPESQNQIMNADSKIENSWNRQHPENILENKAENQYQNSADNESFDKIEKGKTIVDPKTNEFTTDL